jgi:threonine/homoserine/homoserine lactone efflux protein
MALTALTAYTTSQTFTGIAIVALTFGAVNLPSILCWAVLGLQMRRFLTNPTRLRIFNWTMAALLVATLYPILKTA